MPTREEIDEEKKDKEKKVKRINKFLKSAVGVVLFICCGGILIDYYFYLGPLEILDEWSIAGWVLVFCLSLCPFFGAVAFASRK